MDSNGYNKSLFDTRDGVCWLCKREIDTARHEVFEGTGNRKLSKLVGLWLCLCPTCHRYVHGKVHRTKDQTYEEWLKEKGEQLFRNTYSADFTKLFYGAPKPWELRKLAEEVKKREQYR